MIIILIIDNYTGPFIISEDNNIKFECVNDFILNINKLNLNNKIGHSLFNEPGIPNIYINKINNNNKRNGFYNVNYINNLNNIKIPNFYSSNKKIDFINMKSIFYKLSIWC